MIIFQTTIYNVNMWLLTLEMLCALREFQHKIGPEYDVVLHYGAEGNHKETGYHPKGQAVDMHLRNGGLIVPIQEQYEITTLKWSGGIGVYPYWNDKGLHIDLGPGDRRWWRDAGGNYKAIHELNWTEV